MSLGSWEGLDGARAGRLSEASSRGAEWSSSEEDRFSGVALELPPLSCRARGAYWEELDVVLEENMARGGYEQSRTERARGEIEGAPTKARLKQAVAPVPGNRPESGTA